MRNLRIKLMGGTSAQYTIIKEKYHSLAIFIVIFLSVIYTLAFLLGVYVGYVDSKIYHEVESQIQEGLKNSTILKIYNETLHYISQGNMSLALSNILYLTIHEFSYDFLSAIIPVLPSYTFYIHGIISAPISNINRIILLTAFPLIMGKVIGYSIIGSVTLLLILDKLLIKKQLVFKYIQRLIVGFILLLFLSLSNILYSMIADLIYSS